MKFISDCIQHICNTHSNLSNIKIVLPHQYSIVYFKKEFKKKINNNFFPEFITLSNFIQEYSKLSLIEDISLWIIAYSIYLKKNPEEKFYNFLKWIPTMLNDFDNILFYNNIPKQIINFMTSNQRIQSWNLNLKLKNYQHAPKDLLFWKTISIFYDDLNKELLQKKIALRGMISRIAFNNIIKNNNIKDFHYFIGFNFLNHFESKIIKHLIKDKKAEIIINADKYYIDNNIQESGKFLRKILKWEEINPKKLNFINKNFSNFKTIKQYPLHSSIMNAKILINILNKIPQKEYKDTAIILCDEKLLLPVIQSLPKKIKKININLDISFSSFSISLFFLKFFQIKNEIKKNKNKIYFFDLKELLDNSFLPEKLKLSGNLLLQKLVNNNTLFIDHKIIINHFKNFPIHKLFHQHKKPKIFIQQLIHFTNYIIKNYNDNNNTNKIILIGINELLHQFYEILYELNFFSDFQSLYLLFKKLIQQKKLSFIKNVDGLHITGLIQATPLNFKNLIILSANETAKVNKNNKKSFIPLTIKKQFKINDFVNNEAIITYYFYQLIQNANNIHFTYNICNNEEKHHFIRQLEAESPHKIETIKYKFLYQSNFKKKTIIKKTLYVQKKIDNWLNQGLSSTSIGIYLKNPINFYKKYILNIQEYKTVEKQISNKEIGKLIHIVLFNCYKNFIKKKLKINDFNDIENSINFHLNDTIKKLKIYPIKFGINYLHIQLAYKLIKSIIQFDRKLIDEGNSLQIINLEHPLKINFPINKKYSTSFKGIIDRIDILNDVTRIIDYKTQVSNKEYIFSSSIKNNEQHIIQMIIYLYCYAKTNQLKYLQIGIWGFNKINDGVKLLYYINNDNNKTNILQFNKIEQLIYLKLKKIIQEIINFKKPFIEKE